MTVGAAAAAAVDSPCNNVCRIDAASGWCEGCRRSLDEIAAWSGLSQAQRRAILAQLPQRLPAPVEQRPAASR